MAGSKGPLLLAFFRADCPICQFSVPYLQRLSEQARAGIRVIGVAQEGAAAAEQLARTFGLTFPIALDAAPKHTATRAYGLTHVPTVFWVGADGRVAQTTVGFDKAAYEQMAQAAGAEKLFTAEEDRSLPPRRPG